jgi:hypothetical protein
VERLFLAAAMLSTVGCATTPHQASGFFTRFALPPKATMLLISPTWSDRGLAMLELLREAKVKHPSLHVVMVVLDDLPIKAWRVAAAALKVPGTVRRAEGLGLEGPPFGPVKEVPLLYWVSRDERIVQSAVGFIERRQLMSEIDRFLEDE